jgi:pimeloyl-ACP methyl ester carboxylesterase
MHGTPGSFLEVGPIINNLTHPPPGEPAFHVVAPNLPGYAFSPAPPVQGMGPAHIGDALNELMHQLHYTKYVLQAGDYGGIILRYMAGQHPESVVSVLSNFWMVTPNATDMARHEKGETTAAENSTIQVLQKYEEHGSGYRIEMGTTPLQVVVATTDSPMGNLMFNYQIMWLNAAGYTWPLKTIVLWSMMYWLPGPYAAERHYREMANAGIFSGYTLGNKYPYVEVPVAISEYPGDLWFGTVC